MGKTRTLVKIWKGKSYKAIIENGVYYLGSTHGKRFKSLSGLAGEITGRVTSGKTFFGIWKAK